MSNFDPICEQITKTIFQAANPSPAEKARELAQQYGPQDLDRAIRYAEGMAHVQTATLFCVDELTRHEEEFHRQRARWWREVARLIGERA